MFSRILLLLELNQLDDAASAVDALLAKWRPRDARDGRVIDLANRFEKAGRSDVANKIIARMIDAFHKDLIDLIPDSHGVQDARELATILMTKGRRADIFIIVKELTSADAGIGDQRADASIRADIMLSIAGDPAATETLESGLEQKPNEIGPQAEDQVERTCAIISLSDKIGHDLTQRAIDAATGRIKLRDQDDRAFLFAKLAQRIALAGHLNQARRMAEDNVNPQNAFVVYKTILDLIVEAKKLSVRTIWGLTASEWFPIGSNATKRPRVVC